MAQQAHAITATVLSISDGDTIRVRRSNGRPLSVRLACIDAPEIAQSPWGQQARAYLQQRLPLGREVALEVTSQGLLRTIAQYSGFPISRCHQRVVTTNSLPRSSKSALLFPINRCHQRVVTRSALQSGTPLRNLWTTSPNRESPAAIGPG